MDVLGNEIPDPVVEVELETGPNVRQDGDRYLAALYGYVCVMKDQISVLPPFWVAPDKMEAHLVFLAQAGEGIAPDDGLIRDGLAAAGVTHGLIESDIEKTCQQPYDAAAIRGVLVAKAAKPIDGVDAHVKFEVDPEKKSGTFDEDGTIDFRERNAAIGVVENQLLGTLITATKGQPGTDVTGETLAAKDGEEKDFKAGDNVRTESDAEGTKFLAAIDGNIEVKEGEISVNEILAINGDVDYEIGNVDALGDVAIQGSMGSGFKVKAGGSITIGGIIDSGADVDAGGAALVARGIVGESTVVKTAGDVETKFIQNSRVEAGGDLNVGSYIYNATVHVGGHIDVQAGGGEHGGSIVGGEVYAAGGITACRFGSESSEKTVVGIGHKPEVAAELDKLEETVKFYEDNIQKICNAVGLKRSDEKSIKKAVKETPPERRKAVAPLLAKLQQLNVAWKEAFAKQRDLRTEHKASLGEATIAASVEVFPGVEICMGEECMRTADELKASIFALGEDGIMVSEPTAEAE